MKIVRFKADGAVRYGELYDETVRVFGRSPFSTGEKKAHGREYRLADVKLLTPCRPSKLVCIGLNYRTHALELSQPLPPAPLLFLKPPSAVLDPGGAIIMPPDSRRVDYEAELGVVIGKRAKNVPAERALESVLGYTCFNDVTERAVQKEDGQWTRAKSYDTFAPFGPWIETDISPDDLLVEAYLNGERRQSGRTSDLIFPVPELVSFISGVMTLLPGDIIATGTPSGIGPMKAGDVIEVRIKGIGTLKNTIVSAGGIKE